MAKVYKIWGINFLLATLDGYFSFLEERISKNKKIILTGINPYSLSIVKENPLMLDALRITTIANVDGILLKYTLQIMGYDVPDRLDTPSIFIKLMELCAKRKLRVFLLGSRSENIPAIENALIKAFPGIIIAGSHHGYFDNTEEDGIVKVINRSRPDVLILGMPSAKKELFIYHNYEKLNFNVSLGVGGVFEILAGNKKPAPVIIKKMNIEWLYRFVQEPRRLFGRYKSMFLYYTWFVIRNMKAIS